MPRSKRSRSGRLWLFAIGLVACGFWLSPAAHLPHLLGTRVASAATTFTVTTAADSGAGSFRQAIEDANANPGPDTIVFQIGTVQKTITLLSDLPIINSPVLIDGTTQPGYAGTPIVELNGNGANRNTNHGGLWITAGNSTVRGLVINRFNSAAIVLTENGGNVVEGCYIGTDPTGTLRRSNSDGIVIGTTQNRIGGPTPAQRNVISGNNGGGVGSFTTAATGNTIQGNYIGTNAAGTAGLSNNIGVFGPLGNSLIGGVAPGEGNLISGNSGSGIDGGLNNIIQGNLIGTDVTGMKAVPNADRGIRLSGALAGNRIGGAEPGARNIISGNVGAGIGIEDGATGTVVQGNYIGVAADGTSPLPNTTFTAGNSRGGVFVKYSSDNTIGGVAPGEGNVIAFNGDAGVVVVPVDPSAVQQGITVRGNSIYSNAALGIDLVPFGVTPNDAGDADAGANNLQNFPVVNSYSSDGATTTVSGTLGSKPNTAYALDFYANAACDPSGHGEGAQYLGSAQLTTDAAGNAAFNLTLPAPLAAGRAVTATATDPAGSTSEFSSCDATRATGSLEFAVATMRVIEDIGALAVSVVRTGGTAGAVAVNYETFDGTATPGADYLTTQGTLTFAPGETQKTFTVQIINDSVNENTNETFGLRLTSGGGPESLGARSSLIVTLLDSSQSPFLSVPATSVAEGNAGGSPRPVSVTLSAATGRTVTVSYMTETGFSSPATPGVDFQHVSGSLTFAPGETQKTVLVPVVGDTLDEFDETFRLTLTNPVNAFIPNVSPSHISITDDDAQPTLSVGDVTVTEGTGGETIATFPLAFSGPSGKSMDIGVAVTPGTASAGSDYVQPSPPTFIFVSPGQTPPTSFSVRVVADSFDEQDETFFLDIGFGQNVTVTDAQGKATILDDDDGALHTVYVSDAAASDGSANGGATANAVFTVRLDAPSQQPVSVSYATADGTATAGSDYQPTSGTLTLNPGETQKTVTVAVVADSASEPDETFFLNLSNATAANIGDAQGRATITDGAATEPLTVSVDDVTVTESDSNGGGGFVSANFVLRLSRMPVSQVSVQYTTSPGTAVAGSGVTGDYSNSFGAVLFPPGGTTTSISVVVFGDHLDEFDEHFFLDISNPINGATIADARGQATILDNDPPPTLSATDITVTEGDSGVASAFVTVSLSTPSGKPVSFNYATADSTAVAGADYVATTGAATIQPGSSSINVAVPIVGDTAREEDEHFFLNLSSPTNALLPGTQFRINVRDNDTPRLRFAAPAYTVGEGDGRLTLTVLREGDPAPPVSAHFVTNDNPAAVRCDAVVSTAFARCDYATTVETLHFAAGQTQQTVVVPIIDDAHDETDETFVVELAPAEHGVVVPPPQTLTVTITDNDTAAVVPNPLDSHAFFVRQHYLDFLSREPEAGEPWTDVLNNCPNAFNTDPLSPSALCDRNLVSSAFFRSPEFQLKGFYVFRFYTLSLRRLPTYAEIVRDMRAVTGQTPEEVFAKRAAFADDWMRREEMVHLILLGGNGPFVFVLMNQYQLDQITTPDPANPDGTQKVVLTTTDLVNRLNAGTLSHAQVLRAIADSDEVSAAEFRRAFVAMQYFGYLRRDPEEPGFTNWLNYLNQNPQDFRTMVDGFMNSTEYRLRFGQP